MPRALTSRRRGSARGCRFEPGRGTATAGRTSRGGSPSPRASARGRTRPASGSGSQWTSGRRVCTSTGNQRFGVVTNTRRPTRSASRTNASALARAHVLDDGVRVHDFNDASPNGSAHAPCVWDVRIPLAEASAVVHAERGDPLGPRVVLLEEVVRPAAASPPRRRARPRPRRRRAPMSTHPAASDRGRARACACASGARSHRRAARSVAQRTAAVGWRRWLIADRRESAGAPDAAPDHAVRARSVGPSTNRTRPVRPAGLGRPQTSRQSPIDHLVVEGPRHAGRSVPARAHGSERYLAGRAARPPRRDRAPAHRRSRRRARPDEESLATARFMLALDDDTTGFHRRFAHDPLVGPSARALVGYRPRRVATVAHAVVRALCGQLIEHAARVLERAIARACGDDVVTQEALRRLSPVELRRLGLAQHRATALHRLAATIDFESLRRHPTRTVAARLGRERTVGPVVGRRDRARGPRPLRPRHRRRPLARQAPLLADGTLGRRARVSAALLAPYGEWQGLAGEILLLGWARRASAHPPARRIAPRRARRAA